VGNATTEVVVLASGRLLGADRFADPRPQGIG